MSDANAALIALTWAELFDEVTPQLYRPPLHDTLSLTDELLEIAQHAILDTRWTSHVPGVIAELQQTAESDPSLRSLFGKAAYRIATLSPDEPVHRLVSTCHVLLAELEQYDSHVQDRFLAVPSLLPKEKASALAATASLGTLAIRRGLPRDHCREIVDEPVFQLAPTEVAERIVTSLTHTQQVWRCILGLNGDTSAIQSLFSGTDFRPLPNRQKPPGHLGTRFLQLTEGSFRVFQDLEASGAMNALFAAIQPVRQIIDVANFYHRSAPFTISPHAFLVSGGDQRIIPLQRALTPMQPQRGARQRAVDLQRSGNLARFPDRLHASLEQHSLAQTSADLKVRFLNLWVALETLVGRPKQGSIVDAVVRAVVPLVVHRRVNDTLKYLAISLHQFGFCRSSPDSTGWFVRSDKTEVKRDELLLALTTPTEDAVRKALEVVVREHPLLCNRIFTVWRSLETPEQLRRWLTKARRQTEWQLHRIYRARNLLVHAGASVPTIPYLYELLEYYYSLTISRVIHDLQRNVGWAIEDSFEYRRLLNDYIHHHTGIAPCRLTVQDFLQGASPLSASKLWS